VTGRQLAFDLEHRPALGADDFLVAPNNTEAIDWIDKYPDWPTPALTVAGPSGSGKTHLSKVFQSDVAAIEIEPTSGLEPKVGWPTAPAVVIDNADAVCGHAIREEGLFHLYNHAMASGMRLFLTASEPPARWAIDLPDLASRLRASAVATIGPPEDSLLIAVMAKQFADRQISVSNEVLRFAVSRIERSFSAVRQFVADTDRLSMETKRRVTVPLAREVLSPSAD
jgi:DnaA regulatory inactivator Hda